MEHLLLSSQTLIADLLACSPRIAPLFIELRVNCIGCSMNRFCTLAELCRQYEMDLEKVMNSIQERM
jgi:hypothetical protein